MIHHKSGSRKFYDLAERHLDAALLSALNPCSDEESLLCWRVLRRIGAVGLLWNKHSPAFLGIELNAESRRHVFARLEQEGLIERVMVESISAPFYFRAEELSLFGAPLLFDLTNTPQGYIVGEDGNTRRGYERRRRRDFPYGSKERERFRQLLHNAP